MHADAAAPIADDRLGSSRVVGDAKVRSLLLWVERRSEKLNDKNQPQLHMNKSNAE